MTPIEALNHLLKSLIEPYGSILDEYCYSVIYGELTKENKNEQTTNIIL